MVKIPEPDSAGRNQYLGPGGVGEQESKQHFKDLFLKVRRRGERKELTPPGREIRDPRCFATCCPPGCCGDTDCLSPGLVRTSLSYRGAARSGSWSLTEPLTSSSGNQAPCEAGRTGPAESSGAVSSQEP